MPDHTHPSHEPIGLRPPEQVMRLERMGASFQTRLSFMRQLIRRMRAENWSFDRLRFDVDDDGYGTSVFTARTPTHVYSLVAFTRQIDPAERTDRVIAEVWDATFSLFDGLPSQGDIDRLQANTPKQEGGRFRASELTLSRANKSVRLFEHVVQALAEGRQPDINQLADVGYLMRTTAVYGSGKFGCADRRRIADRQELAAPFQAELLTVYLIRWFTVHLVNHVAAKRGGANATTLDPAYARFLGIGNSTGLGMAPFLVNHPQLINNWVTARETALARVRSVPTASSEQIAAFQALSDQARLYTNDWNVADEEQSDRIVRLRDDLRMMTEWCQDGLAQPMPWDALVRYAETHFSLEGQEFTAALVLELQGQLIDDLAETMSAGSLAELDPAMAVDDLRTLTEQYYGWALSTDYSEPNTQQRFWYYSEDKLEPRLGDRYAENGAELEMPLAIGRDVCLLVDALSGLAGDTPIGTVLRNHPELRKITRRVQALAARPYGEIRDNLLDARMRPLDILRFKLAFFGVGKFDPKSDLWTRVNMYQGAPMPMEIANQDLHGWMFPLKPDPTGGVAAS